MGIETLGLIAGTITSITFLPQVIHIYKTKSVESISLNMLLLLILGVVLWLVYGFITMVPSIIYTNSMVFTMSLIMLYFKLTYKKK